MNTINEQKQFFSLLQAGLWGGKPSVALFAPAQTNWMSLLKRGKKQALLGIAFDGMQALPEELRPARPIYLQWCNLVSQIEEENHQLNGEIRNLFTLYREGGLTPILLKGQGVAQNYRNPLHRQSGDIDVYIGKKDYERANQLLRQEHATNEHEEHKKHSSFTWHGVEVENHCMIANLNAPRADEAFQHRTAFWFPNGKEVEVDGYRVLVPPVEFDAVFLLIHAAIHFLGTGIGLRQVCDWTCLLHAHHSNLDQRRVITFLQQTGMYRMAKAFGAIAVTCLGLPASELPFELEPDDLDRGEQLLVDILQMGNFGQYDAQTKPRPKGYWSGKWHTYRKITTRCRQFGAYAPTEARWYPVRLALDSLQIQIKKRL